MCLYTSQSAEVKMLFVVFCASLSLNQSRIDSTFFLFLFVCVSFFVFLCFLFIFVVDLCQTSHNFVIIL